MCTGITLKAKDGTVVFARTLEFAADIESDLIMVPKGYERHGSTPNGKTGCHWTSQYASVGISALDLPVIIDGLNEKGLAMGLFYFPGFTQYMPYSDSDAEKTIAPWELGSWILENFQTVDEVKDGISNIVVANVILDVFSPDAPPPCHFVVSDATGKSIVIEYVGGKLNIHDNPLGVMTNSPTFDWHMTNLRNYVNFSLTNAPSMELAPVNLKTEPVKLSPLGQGSGMLGIPGDFTPPSRFVRAVAYSQSVSEAFSKEFSEGEYFHAADGEDAVLQAFHLLNNFDIPRGVAREVEHQDHENGTVLTPADYTLWTSANDLKAIKYYFRTYENSRIRVVDLKASINRNPKQKQIKRLSIAGGEDFQEFNF
jgi:choloylglycine hydrolase